MLLGIITRNNKNGPNGPSVKDRDLKSKPNTTKYKMYWVNYEIHWVNLQLKHVNSATIKDRLKPKSKHHDKLNLTCMKLEFSDTKLVRYNSCKIRCTICKVRFKSHKSTFSPEKVRFNSYEVIFNLHKITFNPFNPHEVRFKVRLNSCQVIQNDQQQFENWPKFNGVCLLFVFI